MDPSTAPSSTRAMVVSSTNAVNHPIKLTKPPLGGADTEANKLCPKMMKEALEPLGKVYWDLHSPPWKHLLFIEQLQKGGGYKWIMRNEPRRPAAKTAERILRRMVGLDVLDADEIDELKLDWELESLIFTDESIDEMWKSVGG